MGLGAVVALVLVPEEERPISCGSLLRTTRQCQLQEESGAGSAGASSQIYKELLDLKGTEMARPPGTGQPFASPLGMAELFVRLLWCRAPCWGGPIRAVAVLGPVRGPARASLRPLHPRLGHRLPASTASQLVAIRLCAVKSSSHLCWSSQPGGLAPSSSGSEGTAHALPHTAPVHCMSSHCEPGSRLWVATKRAQGMDLATRRACGPANPLEKTHKEIAVNPLNDGKVPKRHIPEDEKCRMQMRENQGQQRCGDPRRRPGQKSKLIKIMKKMVLATSMKESKSERPDDADQTLFAKLANGTQCTG
ncbi:hypothetical protein Anapl_08016 [Anas platyrhynchos]|uniref:Uncharacterized protein n=1 Tax=Anas platyrhynchos TaxID=8839 RepID=R0JL41_ANAPL|nr:hypothetical protein Anapl_08016 [Anas platyrhynchos]